MSSILGIFIKRFLKVGDNGGEIISNRVPKGELGI